MRKNMHTMLGLAKVMILLGCGMGARRRGRRSIRKEQTQCGPANDLHKGTAVDVSNFYEVWFEGKDIWVMQG